MTGFLGSIVAARRVVVLWVLCVALSVLGLAGPGAADQPFSFAATPGRLPKSVAPTHYAIELTPDLDSMTTSGVVVATIEIAQPVDRLVLNALDLTIATAAIEGEPTLTAEVALDAEAETATMTFPRALAAGTHKLRIGFTSKINRFGRGLFAIDYPTDSGRKRMIASHLEPAEARRIFPNWDEPAFKAVFELTVTVPAAFLAVSNMPIASETPVDAATKRVAFAPTPRMSSYLFALIAGELERATVKAGEVEIGVVATTGKSANAGYALDAAKRLLGYFDDYFGVPYSLPKLDLIALPGGFGGAMENWGAITFFESRLLFDPATSPPSARRGIFVLIAHEMAHQWFGNLVTMAWWNDLWLNEGFASWMQNKAAEVLHPEWRIWLGGEGKQRAMAEDARRTTKPIQRQVADESEARSAFDSITYSKGQAVIRMLEGFLGEDAFRAGIRLYMRERAYSNATTADLWAALESASGRTVAAIARGFTEQPGVPLIVAETRCIGDEQRVRLRQERFATRDPAAHPLRWQVPMLLGAPGGSLVLDGTAEIAAGKCGEPFKLNLGDVGYYRVLYDDAGLAALARGFASLSPADRVNLLADGWALMETGRVAPSRYFELVEAIAPDDDREVWEQAIRGVTRLDFLQRGRTERAAFQAYARARLRPLFDRVGWERVAGESAAKAMLRPRLIRVLGDLGDEDILAEARRRFDAFRRDPASVAPGLRASVLHFAGREADRATYDALLALGRQATNTEERVRYYTALAAARDPALAAETLALALTEELPTNLSWSVISWVAGQGEHPDLAWDFVRANFPALSARQGPAFRDYIASSLASNFAAAERASELASFAPAQATPAGRIAAARAQEQILANADFRANRLPAIDDWIRERARRP